MKIDPYKHKEKYLEWKNKLNGKIPEITSYNSQILLDFLEDMEHCLNVAANNKEEFLLQPRHNESLTHCFAVYDIAEYLEKKGFKVEKYATKKPDLVFKKGNKLWAIEVETGAVLTKESRMKEKMEVLNKYDKMLFVVTDRNKVSHYKRFGESVDLRYLKPRLREFLR
jgi:hypothetical protein